MRFKKPLSILAAAAAVVLAGVESISTVRAEDFATDVPDLVWIDVGGGINEVSTDVAFRGPKGIGATINFEDAFGLPGNKTTARMLGTVRISAKRRWIDFGYVDIGRWGTKTIDSDIAIGDYILQAGAAVRAHFATQFAYAAFRYDFLHEEKVRISGSAGLTWLRLITGFSGNGTYTPPDGGTPVTGDFSKEASAGAPVPMVGLNLDWALTRRLVLRTYTRFFRIRTSSFNGGLGENGLRLNYYFVKNFGLGLGIDRTDLKLNELKIGDGNIVKAGYIINGIGLYATLAF